MFGDVWGCLALLGIKLAFDYKRIHYPFFNSGFAKKFLATNQNSMKFRFLFSALVAFAIFSLIAFSSSGINAQRAIETEDDADSWGETNGGDGTVCYTTFNKCRVGCDDSTLICEYQDCVRKYYDSKSDRSTCP
jgi:hypothetical protein